MSIPRMLLLLPHYCAPHLRVVNVHVQVQILALLVLFTHTCEYVSAIVRLSMNLY